MAESLPTEWFINDHAIIDQAIAVLNEALVADQSALTELMLMEVEVNEQLVEHPTIQVGKDQLGYPPILRPLGLINGLFGVDKDNRGFITARTDSTGMIVEFIRTPPR